MTRTVAVVAEWYMWPDHRFVAIPAVIVVLYLIAIAVLVNRPCTREATTMEAL